MCSSLVDLCLDLIVNNFQTFNSIFNTTNNEDLKKNFLFLQKIYSFDLIKRLGVTQNSFPEEFLDLLINKYLKILVSSWFDSCSKEKIISKISEMGCNVEKIIIDVDFSEQTSQCQDIICHLPNLRSFVFHEDCQDLILKSVAKFCPNIEEIDVQDSPVLGESVAYLCQGEDGKNLCRNLKKLLIDGTDASRDAVEYLLKNLPALEIVDHPELPLALHSMHKNDFSFASYNITTLNLIGLKRSPSRVDILKVCLTVCPHLKSIYCDLKREDEFVFFSNLSDLEVLYMRNTSDSKMKLDNLLESIGGKLTFLRVENCTISLSVLAKNCSVLQELHLIEARLVCDDEPKPVFNSLSTLLLRWCNDSTIPRAVGLLLTSSKYLESLSLENCNLLSSEIKAHILKYCERHPVKEISFCFSKIEKEFIKDILSNCSTLSNLYIDDCFEDDESEKELLEFTKLLSNKPEIDYRY